MGLLHVSNICAERLEHPREAGLDLSMLLWVKVSDVNNDEAKYGVDMRYVSQKDGTDLDPYQAKGRLPDNFFVGKGSNLASASSSATQTAPANPQKDLPELASASAPNLDRKKKRKAVSSSTEDSESIDNEKVAEARAKAQKKLEKAKKKLEKAKKK